MTIQKILDPVMSMAGLENDFAFRYDQEIPDEFLTRIKDQRFGMAKSSENDFMEVADVPVAVVDQWKRQGFDIMKEEVTADMIVKRLRSEGLEAFISTNKRV